MDVCTGPSVINWVSAKITRRPLWKPKSFIYWMPGRFVNVSKIDASGGGHNDPFFVTVQDSIMAEILRTITYEYPPPCFLARERVLSYFFQIFHFRDFFSETSFQNNFNSTQYREKDSQNNFFYQRITSFKGPHASSLHSLRGSPPPFRHQKTTEKNSVNKSCFFEICVSPGPQKWLPKLTNAHLGASISRFFSFSAKVWFWTTLPWFSVLLWLSCVTFSMSALSDIQ